MNRILMALIASAFVVTAVPAMAQSPAPKASAMAKPMAKKPMAKATKKPMAKKPAAMASPSHM